MRKLTGSTSREVRQSRVGHVPGACCGGPVSLGRGEGPSLGGGWWYRLPRSVFSNGCAAALECSVVGGGVEAGRTRERGRMGRSRWTPLVKVALRRCACRLSTCMEERASRKAAWVMLCAAGRAGCHWPRREMGDEPIPGLLNSQRPTKTSRKRMGRHVWGAGGRYVRRAIQ